MPKGKEVIERALESVLGGCDSEDGLRLDHVHCISLEINLNEAGEVVPEDTGIKVNVNLHPMRHRSEQ